MICKACGEQNHDNCKNVGTETNTWCDCQHQKESVLPGHITNVHGSSPYITINVDPLMPEGEIEFRLDNAVVGKIVNIHDD